MLSQTNSLARTSEKFDCVYRWMQTLKLQAARKAEVPKLSIN